MLPTAEADVGAPDPYRASRRKLPVLENLRLASPCDVSWDAMVGNGRVRHCAQCSKQVFNISAMSHFDAQIFLLEQGKGACLHFYRRADGTLLTSDCPMSERLRLRWQSIHSFVALVWIGLMALIGVREFGKRVETATGTASTGGDWGCELPSHTGRGTPR